MSQGASERVGAMSRGLTRRELAAASLAAATGVSGLAATDDASAMVLPPQTEPQVLTRVLLAERLIVTAYRRIIDSGKLTPAVARTLNGLLAHELEHISAIAPHLSAMGEPAPTGPLDLATAQALLVKHGVSGGLRHLPPTEKQCLVMLVDLESVAEGAYFNGLRDLHDTNLIRLSAEIMCCEAQHWTVLMELVNPGKVVYAVPWPFVIGTS